jgi:type II secretory pathway component PulJ
VKTESKNRKTRSAGLTVLEMLVSTTLLVFIMVGLTAMFVQTQKAFQAGTKQAGVTDVGGTVADMIASDLAQLSDARNTNIVNLYFGWDPVNYTVQSNSGFVRTNQAQEIFMLVRTNGQWEGIGYGVSNNYTGGAGGGTLYRFSMQTNAPLLDNSLFNNFMSNVVSQTFNSNNCHRIADGVIHLKIYAYDQLGNENTNELVFGDYNTNIGYFTYPLSGGASNYVYASSNDLPASIQLEVGVLEPDTYAQARALSGIVDGSGAPTSEITFLSKAVANVHLFRQEIPIAGAVR